MKRNLILFLTLCIAAMTISGQPIPVQRSLAPGEALTVLDDVLSRVRLIEGPKGDTGLTRNEQTTIVNCVNIIRSALQELQDLKNPEKPESEATPEDIQE